MTRLLIHTVTYGTVAAIVLLAFAAHLGGAF